MATLPRRTADVSEDHPRPSGGRLPEWGDRLGCGACGLPAQEHGSSVIHRFVRPDLPDGYRYRDELGTGDERALHRRPVEQSTVVLADLRPHRTASGTGRADA